MQGSAAASNLDLSSSLPTWEEGFTGSHLESSGHSGHAAWQTGPKKVDET
jgi:hypothetical protein